MALSLNPTPGTNRQPKSACSPGYGINQLAHMIQTAIQTQINGQLAFTSHSGLIWTLNFRVGRLVWASGGDQAMRRWRRLLKQVCKLTPDAVQDRAEDMPPLWEPWLLEILIKRQKITRQAAATLVEQAVQEVLFDLLQASPSIQHISPVEDALADSKNPISILSTADMLRRAQAELTEWFNLGLMAYSPNAAPRVVDAQALRQQVTPKLAQALSSLALGKASVRELATLTSQTTLAIGHLIAAPVQKGIIELMDLPDIANPYKRPKKSARSGLAPASARLPSPKQSAKLGGLDSPQFTDSSTAVEPSPQSLTVLCVDDSAQVSYILEQILQPAGYRFIGVQDSVEALSAILKHKPDLIFLDLIMPLVYGNEICTQLRRAPVFRNVPIIMLSSNTRMLDHLQAKGAGATDFMSKPIEASKVLAMLTKYLGPAPVLSRTPAATDSAPADLPLVSST